MSLKQSKIIFYLSAGFFSLVLINWGISKYTVSIPNGNNSLLESQEVIKILNQKITELGDDVKKKRVRVVKIKNDKNARTEILIDVPIKFSVPDFLKILNDEFQNKNIKISSVENYKTKINSIHVVNHDRVIATLILE